MIWLSRPSALQKTRTQTVHGAGRLDKASHRRQLYDSFVLERDCTRVAARYVLHGKPSKLHGRYIAHGPWMTERI